MPEGTQAVLTEEYTSRDDEYINAYADARPGRNVLEKGSDVKVGQVLVRAGETMIPQRVGLLIAGGITEVEVYKKPKIGLLATGSEVIMPGQPMSDGKVYASNVGFQQAWLTMLGFDVSVLSASDSVERISESMMELSATCDVVITSGGAWKGDRDHNGDSEGILKLTYEDDKVQVSFTNDEGVTITTSKVAAGSCSSTKVRIWGLGGSGSQRYVDNVKIISLCGDGSGSDTGGTGDGIMPLTIGNWWECSYSAGAISGTFRMEAAATQMVNGVMATRVDYTGDLYADDYLNLLANEGNDLNYYGDPINGTLTTPDLWCRSTFKVGDTWQTKGQGGVVNWVVVSISEKVTVGAGTFTCIHTLGTGTSGTSAAEHWWAVGVGDVKFTSTTSSSLFVGELEDYSVK